jgi:hypothetical protein
MWTVDCGLWTVDCGRCTVDPGVLETRNGGDSIRVTIMSKGRSLEGVEEGAERMLSKILKFS